MNYSAPNYSTTPLPAANTLNPATVAGTLSGGAIAGLVIVAIVAIISIGLSVVAIVHEGRKGTPGEAGPTGEDGADIMFTQVTGSAAVDITPDDVLNTLAMLYTTITIPGNVDNLTWNVTTGIFTCVKAGTFQISPEALVSVTPDPTDTNMVLNNIDNFICKWHSDWELRGEYCWWSYDRVR